MSQNPPLDRTAPLLPEVPDAFRLGTLPAEPDFSTPARILVVDDLPENIQLLGSLLEPLGYEILSAGNGREALERVAAHPPDLVLLDVVMPEMDGLAVCKQLKSDPRTRLIPIVMITALHGEREKLRAIESGADDFLNKPFSQAELLARVKALLRLKRYTDELELVETALFSLALVVESRDPHTGDHCERLSRMTVRFGQRLLLREEDLRALRRGGYLHDIGKVAIPDAILLKPARLTEEEWAVMRRHTLIGEEVCKPLRSLASVLPIIRSHHERWNGTGYPDGLAGEAIPLLARIFQIADIYDALCATRPYKGALTPAAALELMQREIERGWIDPHLFDIFRHAHSELILS